ncbi:MAG: lipoyl(octanoyl) transferase LipB [Alphaproteobacteria bacterium]|nr:lipoyl(octanoyl) transferase LipB [Alphaproteobacteria bacterium]
MEYIVSSGHVEYQDAHDFMEQRVAAIRDGAADEAMWLLEHPALYTAGSSAKDDDLLDARFPVYQTGRGGQYTYHGPGQRVGYVMLDLKARQSAPDIKAFICKLEEWLIRTLAEFGIKGERREGRVGIWVDLKPYGRVGEAKIAAIGVRIRRWVTFHGVSLNLDPDLDHFNGIVPCGLAAFGVTSLKDLGVSFTKEAVDEALRRNFSAVFDGGAIETPRCTQHK